MCVVRPHPPSTKPRGCGGSPTARLSRKIRPGKPPPKSSGRRRAARCGRAVGRGRARCAGLDAVDGGVAALAGFARGRGSLFLLARRHAVGRPIQWQSALLQRPRASRENSHVRGPGCESSADCTPSAPSPPRARALLPATRSRSSGPG